MGIRSQTSTESSHSQQQHERDRSHPGRAVRQPDRSQVLGDDLRRARDRPHRYLPWGLRPPAGEDKCLHNEASGGKYVLERSWWTWNLGPWTVSGPDPSDRSLDQITSCSDRVEQEITGLRVITLRGPSWWTVF